MIVETKVNWSEAVRFREMEANPRTLCLNTIVKNETPVIGRCLASVRRIMDYWVIVDIGSTDGTQDEIRTLMTDLPGDVARQTK